MGNPSFAATATQKEGPGIFVAEIETKVFSESIEALGAQKVVENSMDTFVSMGTLSLFLVQKKILAPLSNGGPVKSFVSLNPNSTPSSYPDLNTNPNPNSKALSTQSIKKLHLQTTWIINIPCLYIV